MRHDSDTRVSRYRLISDLYIPHSHPQGVESYQQATTPATLNRDIERPHAPSTPSRLRAYYELSAEPEIPNVPNVLTSPAGTSATSFARARPPSAGREARRSWRPACAALRTSAPH